ncbi:hypothetical protein J2S74_002768 [Evansella vedderi]|uniref:Uncharacterized protein n=1 Tax=Evansella vedderi TaxID=38282 RepID=A0ABT9ZXC0_9BACI|nr:hypothetical protein [Evansella vedderi]MDQ0255386.1 hypothetical protein [Evansella vedderi]
MNKWIAEKLEEKAGSGEILISASEPIDYLKKLHAAGQILVDSNDLAFVYILEDPDNFVHIRLPINLWGSLEELRNRETPIFAVFSTPENQMKLELSHFFTELNSLIENIRGNANYGEEMVNAVEKNFPE